MSKIINILQDCYYKINDRLLTKEGSADTRCLLGLLLLSECHDCQLRHTRTTQHWQKQLRLIMIVQIYYQFSEYTKIVQHFITLWQTIERRKYNRPEFDPLETRNVSRNECWTTVLIKLNRCTFAAFIYAIDKYHTI